MDEDLKGKLNEIANASLNDEMTDEQLEKRLQELTNIAFEAKKRIIEIENR